MKSFSQIVDEKKQRMANAPVPVPPPSSPAATAAANAVPKIEARQLDFYYGASQALHGISLKVPQRCVTALIGPSGCGKSTFLRTLNRMNDLIEDRLLTGEVLIDGIDIYGPEIDVVAVRKRVGMVFQKSNPFPKSIFENVAYGPRISGRRGKA